MRILIEDERGRVTERSAIYRVCDAFARSIVMVMGSTLVRLGIAWKGIGGSGTEKFFGAGSPITLLCLRCPLFLFIEKTMTVFRSWTRHGAEGPLER